MRHWKDGPEESYRSSRLREEPEGHSRRVTDLTVNLAELLGVEESQIVSMRRGALLHDIGKLAIPDNILLQRRRVDGKAEWRVMRKHPIYAKEPPEADFLSWHFVGYPL